MRTEGRIGSAFVKPALVTFPVTPLSHTHPHPHTHTHTHTHAHYFRPLCTTAFLPCNFFTVFEIHTFLISTNSHYSHVSWSSFSGLGGLIGWPAARMPRFLKSELQPASLQLRYLLVISFARCVRR